MRRERERKLNVGFCSRALSSAYVAFYPAMFDIQFKCNGRECSEPENEMRNNCLFCDFYCLLFTVVDDNIA